MQLETYDPIFYMTLCSKDEIDRITNPISAEDYLLKLRANATVEHTRIFRVLRSRMMKQGRFWSFSDHFDRTPFDDYKADLNEDDYKSVKDIAAGFIFCNEPNGRIIRTDMGNVISLSLSLRYFLYFMNLAFLQFDETEIPQDVKGAAIKIALRTMLQSEALDFDLDPRGDIPPPIAAQLDYHTDLQLQFVVGHEYSHFFLGHLDASNIVEEPLFVDPRSDYIPQKVFSYAQKEELAADIDAIERPSRTPEHRDDMLNRALFFFAYLDIFQSVKDQIAPSPGHRRTHPLPMDRFSNLLHHFQGLAGINHENVENLLHFTDVIKRSLTEDVAINIESYETYGSIYLGSWRGEVLVDRVDF